MIADLNEEEGKKAAEGLSGRGFKAAFKKTDVAREDDVRAVVAFAQETFGGLDILVNNAGIYPIMPVLSMPLETFEKILATNLRSAFLFTQAASQAMIAQGRGGKIINITSVDALHPSSVGLAAYDASKHGLWGFTKNSALELAEHGIMVNAVAPGGINTPGAGSNAPQTEELKVIHERFLQKIPVKRFGEPDDIGKAVLFLASGLSSYMTGSQVVVDGGVLLS
jgi:2-deoxy-D-gluconate 3-dehydrogenase